MGKEALQKQEKTLALLDHAKDHKDALERKIERFSDLIAVTAQEIRVIRINFSYIHQELDVTTLATKKQKIDNLHTR